MCAIGGRGGGGEGWVGHALAPARSREQYSTRAVRSSGGPQCWGRGAWGRRAAASALPPASRRLRSCCSRSWAFTRAFISCGTGHGGTFSAADIALNCIPEKERERELIDAERINPGSAVPWGLIRQGRGSGGSRGTRQTTFCSQPLMGTEMRVKVPDRGRREAPAGLQASLCQLDPQAHGRRGAGRSARCRSALGGFAA